MDIKDVTRKDWDTNDVSSPVSWLDLTLANIRDYTTKGIQADNIEMKDAYLNLIHEYVRGLSDGNRFMRMKPFINVSP